MHSVNANDITLMAATRILSASESLIHMPMLARLMVRMIRN